MSKVVSFSDKSIVALAGALMLVLFLLHSFIYRPVSIELLGIVDTPFQLGAAETPYLYWFLHAFILIPILALSFDKRVAFYKAWRHLLPAIAVVGAIFILWDFVFTKLGVWGFSHDYTLDIRLLHLPIEEWMFFLSAPFACVFIYECLRYYFPKDNLVAFDKPLSLGLAFIFIVIGIITWGRLYTSFTCIASGVFVLIHYFTQANTYRTFFYKTQLVSFIPFILINGILTGSITKSPIVLYNSAEILGPRFVTIPVEDFVYCFLMLFSVLSLYKYLRARSASV